MEDPDRSRIINKMIRVAFKERFAELAKKYDSQASLWLGIGSRIEIGRFFPLAGALV